MTVYEQIIGAATGVTDLAMVQRIEEAIRIQHPILSGLARREIERAAKGAYAAILMIDAHAKH